MCLLGEIYASETASCTELAMQVYSPLLRSILNSERGVLGDAATTKA